MPTLLQRCVHNTCIPAAFFPIPKILMQTGRRNDFIDYDPIISADIGFVDLPVRIRAELYSHRHSVRQISIYVPENPPLFFTI